MKTYPKVVITLSDTSTLTWQDTEVIEATLIEEVDPISATLPISELRVKVYDKNNDFSVFEPSESLAERQQIDLYEIINATEHYLGRFYLDEWKSPSEQILEIRAVDIIGILDTSPFDGYFFSELTLVENALDIALGGVDISYELSPELVDIKIKGYIPQGTVREALQHICFAAGAFVTTSRRNNIGIEECATPYRDRYHQFDIGVNDKFMDQPTELKPIVTGVDLVSHTYEQSETLETIYEDYLEPGTYKIIFDKPSLLTEIVGAQFNDITFIGTENGEIISTEGGVPLIANAKYVFGPNSITLTVYQPGTVTIKGYTYRDNQRVHKFREELVSYTKDNLMEIKNATLVSPDNANAVLGKVRDYYRSRYIHNMTLVSMTGALYGEGVYAETTYGWSTSMIRPGLMLSIASLQGAYMRSLVEKIDLDLAGGFLLSATAVGVKYSK